MRPKMGFPMQFRVSTEKFPQMSQSPHQQTCGHCRLLRMTPLSWGAEDIYQLSDYGMEKGRRTPFSIHHDSSPSHDVRPDNLSPPMLSINPDDELEEFVGNSFKGSEPAGNPAYPRGCWVVGACSGQG